MARMVKHGGRTGGASSAVVASTVLLAMVATLSSAAAANAVVPQLGYNVIQSYPISNPNDPGDPNGNFYTAKSVGKATWFRGGPGMPEASNHQNDYVARAAFQNFKILYVIPGPGHYDPDNNVPADTTPAQYTGYCHDYVVDHPNVDAFEIMNEANNYMDAHTYAQYAIHCDQGIRSVRPNVPVLGASEARGTRLGVSWQDWLSDFGYYTQYSAPDIIMSSHIYPSGAELDSPQQAANSLETDIAYDLIYSGWLWGVNRDLWVTETGVKDHALANRLGLSSDGQACASGPGGGNKPEYLKQMFLKAGNNNTYNVGKVFIYRFSRNGRNDEVVNDDTGWNSAGVYDSTGPLQGGYFLNGYQDCGMAALAYVAP